jgi:squalene cyclase
MGVNILKRAQKQSTNEETASCEGVFQTEFKNKALSYQPCQVFPSEESECDTTPD